jgi:hypothetical protein
VQAPFNAWAAHDLLGDGADRDIRIVEAAE